MIDYVWNISNDKRLMKYITLIKHKYEFLKKT